tara:strand:- start:311 stop:715 length:405 start_codon:yes stop_codon:yes gene_type:complete
MSQTSTERLSDAGEASVTATDADGNVVTSGIILCWRTDTADDSSAEIKLHFHDYDEMMVYIRAHPEGDARQSIALDDASVMSGIELLAMRNPDKDVAELKKMIAEGKKAQAELVKANRKRQAKEDAGEGRGENP